jgi:hypothetical protein
MAKLTDAKRRKLFADYMERSSADREPLPLSKTELRAAVDATDDWINANAASFSAALSAAARSALTARQKARLLFDVAEARIGEV